MQNYYDFFMSVISTHFPAEVACLVSCRRFSWPDYLAESTLQPIDAGHDRAAKRVDPGPGERCGIQAPNYLLNLLPLEGRHSAIMKTLLGEYPPYLFIFEW